MQLWLFKAQLKTNNPEQLSNDKHIWQIASGQSAAFGTWTIKSFPNEFLKNKKQF